MRSGGLRDRDIIFRDETCLEFRLLGCVVRFPEREANSLAEKGEFESWQLSVCLFSRFSFPSYRFSVFLRSNAHTHINKEGEIHSERPKGDREQLASLNS